MAKRIIDVLGCLFALTLVLPLLTLCALLLKLLSPGPVLFIQLRLGINGKPFDLYKFRTMVHNAPDLRNADGSTYSGADDPRVTRIGHILRSMSLDELPQMFNVLKGDMSLVGPRPDILDAVKYYRPCDHERLKVKPGITGWAVVHGRNGIPWEKRRDLDLEYVRNHSVMFDLAILAATVPLLIRPEGVSQNW